MEDPRGREAADTTPIGGERALVVEIVGPVVGEPSGVRFGDRGVERVLGKAEGDQAAVVGVRGGLGYGWGTFEEEVVVPGGGGLVVAEEDASEGRGGWSGVHKRG